MKTVASERYFLVDAKSNPVLDSQGNIIFGKSKKGVLARGAEELSAKDFAKVAVAIGTIKIK